MHEILLLLLKKGAHEHPVKVSTTEIGTMLSMSQQNASKKLTDLEAEGKIERAKEGLRITQKGLNEAQELYSSLKAAMEREALVIKGKIVEGLGEGGYYVSLEGYQKQFGEKLGFRAFAGTLNVKLDNENTAKRMRLRELEPIIIEGWKTKDRTYGDLFAYKCKLEGKEAAIIIPVRTHHGMEIIELIAPFSVREKLGKKEGGEVSIEIESA